ncbi:hypothetical protein TrVE_jg5315 [Triparma verrucosa]|uniref:Uncharacterized protein n=1 Tax=Triparma verrucosa TaxID=1606542 RepID=A0A9W7BEZ0_9STRA|nr:hypothetical protein TrVE_jg5315 [Triparma verrucosa]
MASSLPPPLHPETSKYSKKELRMLDTVRKVNEEASKTSKLPPLESFNFFDESQREEFASGVDDIMFVMETTRRQKNGLSKTRRLTKKRQKEKEAQWHRLMMSKPTSHPNNWCSSTHLSSELARKLSLPIEADASGSIYSPWRDLPRTKEGQAAWREKVLPGFKPGEIGKIFGESPIHSCSESYQEMLERHLLKTVERVKNDYEMLEWGTSEHCELKGGVGRDLASLEERLKRVKKAMKVRKSASTVALKPLNNDGFDAPRSMSASRSAPALFKSVEGEGEGEGGVEQAVEFTEYING